MTTIGKCRIQVVILVTVFVATVSSSFSDDQPVEYVDNQYQFAFQYPRDWILAEKPAPILIDAGKTRVIVRHPTEPYYVMASITGPINVLSKDKFEKSPRRDEITNGLIQRTIDQIYKKSGGEWEIAYNRPAECPLWVKSRHVQCKTACPLYPQ